MDNFFDLPAEKFWSFPKNYKGNVKAEIKNMIFSGEYLGSVKKDGHYYRFVKDETTQSLQGRNKSTVTGNFLNKIGHVPHLHSFFNKLPKNTCLIGELYFKENEGSKNVTTIMGCKEDKAIQRQENTMKLSFYIFDVWQFDGKSYMNIPIEDRILLLNNLKQQMPKNLFPYVEIAEYKYGDVLWELLQTTLNSGGEGIVMTKKGTHPEPNKRTARKTLKIKTEIENTIDCFFTGNFKPATKLYTGKELDNWKYWENERTGEKINGKMIREFEEGDPIIPITKGHFYGWAGSIEIGVLNKDNKTIVPIGFISGLTDEIKEQVGVKNPKYYFRPCEVTCMEIDEQSGKLRHPKFLHFRDDLHYSDCTLDKFYEQQ